MIPSNSDRSDECVSTKLRVTGNHVFHFSHFELYIYIYFFFLAHMNFSPADH